VDVEEVVFERGGGGVWKYTELLPICKRQVNQMRTGTVMAREVYLENSGSTWGSTWSTMWEVVPGRSTNWEVVTGQSRGGRGGGAWK
jgi:hypothetical protein